MSTRADVEPSPATLVMLVEDERIVALHLSQQLTKLGYQVVAVASGQQALDKVAEVQPDVVLMDIHIDGPIDGIQTAALIPQELEVPVLYLTAYSEEGTLARARATKPYGYLVKPFAARELHASIQMTLERRTAYIAVQRSAQALRLALDASEEGAGQLALANTHLKAETSERQRLERAREALITHALKDALPNGRPAQISVSLRHEPDQSVVLSISHLDLGSADEELAQTGTPGVQLVTLLAERLAADLTIERSSSPIRFELRLPNEP